MIDVKDIDAIIGAEVMDTANDRIGRVSQVYIDSEDQHPSWVSVRTGFFGRSETLIPIDDARWESSTLFVQVDRAKVREAPHVDPDQELSVDEQTALYRYYGKRGADGSAQPEDTAAEQSDSSAAEQPGSTGSAQGDSPAAEQDVDDAHDAAAPQAVEEGSALAEVPSGDASDQGDGSDEAPFVASETAVEAPVDAPVEPSDERSPDEGAGAADAEPASATQAPETRLDDDATADPHSDGGTTEMDQSRTDDTRTETAQVDAAPVDAAPVDDAQSAATDDAGGRRRSNYVVPTEAERAAQAAAATPDDADVVTRYEERLRIATERVPATRIRLVKRIVTEHRTISVPVSHEELHLEREPIGEDEIANWQGPVSELQEEEREIVLMAERPVVSTHTAPIERIRLVREVVSGTHDVEADLRHEQFDLDQGDGGAQQG